jgi:hypothetical protein
MPVNQAAIQQRIVDSIKNNTSGDKDLAVDAFAADLAQIITDAIKSADVILASGAINPTNTTVVAGGFPGTATSVAPITGNLI